MAYLLVRSNEDNKAVASEIFCFAYEEMPKSEYIKTGRVDLRIVFGGNDTNMLLVSLKCDQMWTDTSNICLFLARLFNRVFIEKKSALILKPLTENSIELGIVERGEEKLIKFTGNISPGELNG